MVLKTKLSPLGGGNQAYKKDFVVFESSTPGTSTFEIKKAQFEVTGSGAGGGGGGSAGKHAWYGQVGGSAAAFKGIVQLEKGTLKITVGTPGNGGNGSGRNAGPGTNGTATTVSVNNVTLLTLGGGNGGGGTGSGSGANNGAGGIITVSSKLKIISTKIKTNGTAQSTVSILGNGFGAGGNIRGGTSGLPGTAGYIKIQFVK